MTRTTTDQAVDLGSRPSDAPRMENSNRNWLIIGGVIAAMVAIGYGYSQRDNRPADTSAWAPTRREGSKSDELQEEVDRLRRQLSQVASNLDLAKSDLDSAKSKIRNLESDCP